jgi:hypothetical protein
MMGQAVEQGAGESFGAKDAGPFVERQVAGHDSGGENLLRRTAGPYIWVKLGRADADGSLSVHQ